MMPERLPSLHPGDINAFNHANFGQPNAAADNVNFGRVSSAAPPRLIQLGMKFLF